MQLEVDDQKELESLAASGIRIPPQPKVLAELRDKIAGGSYSVRTLTQIISQDPGLVALLFKASRSPVFSRGRKFDSLDQVLQVLGVKQVYNLVQAAALSTSVSNATRKLLDRFWARAGEVAELAAMIAEDQVSVCNVFPDQAYMAGIFHQCGVPVLMTRFPEYCKELDPDNPQFWASLAAEDAKFNVDHGSVGYLVSRHWGLPDFVCAAIRFFHEPPTEESGAAISLVSILQLAVQVHLQIHLLANPVWDTIGDRVLEEVGLAPSELDDYLDDLSNRFRSAA